MSELEDVVRLTVERLAKENLTDARRQEIAGTVNLWLASRIKGTVDSKLTAFQKRVEELMVGITVKVDAKGAAVLRPRGSDEETLKLLRLGTPWFYGSEEVQDLILAGIFGSTGRT